MTLPRLLTIAYRIYSWVAVAACLAAAAFLLLLALERPVDIAESTALLIAVAAAALSTGLAKMLRRRVGAVMALLFAAAYALWLLAADPGDTGLLVALLGGVVLVETVALTWLRPWRSGRSDPLARPGHRD